jgi:hypothetical protein
LLALTGFLGGVGGSSVKAETGEIVPTSVGPIHITDFPRHLPSARGHVFTFSIMIDACPALLEVDHTSLIERPRVGSHKGTAIVTAYAREPEHEEPQVCPPLPPLFKTVRVRMKRPASQLIIFDGSYSQPRRLYPPAP